MVFSRKVLMMTRNRNIIDPIKGAGKDPENKMTVQKSQPLLSLWRSDMTLAEFKILDTYLARIDSHKPEKRTVIFTKGELEQLLGVKKINKAVLSQRLVNLYRGVEIEKVNSKKLHTIALFEEAYGEMDENGIWTIKLTCSAPAMKYIFNVEDLRYLRYKLRSITNLNSRYTYILFLYLEKNRFRKRWEVKVEDLRHFLNCDNDESYLAFKVFNDRILKRCQKEMHEKTECRYTYEPIKKGRTVVGIRFEVETLPKLETEVPEEPMAEDPSRPLWENALQDWKLSTEQLDELTAMVAMVPSHKLPNCQKEDIEKARYQYIAQKAAEIKRRNEEKRIRSRFSYLRKLMKDDIESKPPQEGKQQTHAVASGTQAFQNFTERQNNYTDKIMDKLKSDLKEFQENQEAVKKK